MVAAVTIDVSQGAVLAAVSHPAQNLLTSQASLQAAVNSSNTVFTSQAVVLAAVAGRTSNPRVRSWPFTLDAHDYYVIRLGDIETLVYDVHSQQWYVWGSDTSDLWRASYGTNWLGGDAFAKTYGSNVLVGDDSNGSIYFLDPDQATDDDPLQGSATPRTFTRKIESQIPLRGYNSARCYGVFLEGSIGNLDDSTLVSVNLSFSDDRGTSYTDAGSLSVSNGVYDTRLQWRSLGAINTPGRIFRVTDTGALKRIDTITAMTDLADEGQ